MRLLPLCVLVHDRAPSVSSGSLAGGATIGWVTGDGAVQGARIHGKLRRFTDALHRADGVNVPQTHGVILCDDGATVFYEIRGYALMSGEHTRFIVGSITFRTSDEAYGWLNAVFGVVEGAYDPDGASLAYQVYECAPDATS